MPETPKRPNLEDHLDPAQAEELKHAEEASRVAGSNPRTDELEAAIAAQRAAKAGTDNDNGPAATSPKKEPAQRLGMVDQVIVTELQELKTKVDKQSAYQLAIIGLIGVVAALLVVRSIQQTEILGVTTGG